MSRSRWAWIASWARAIRRPWRLVVVALVTALCMPPGSMAKPGASSDRTHHSKPSTSRVATVTTASHARRGAVRDRAVRVGLLAVGSGYGHHHGDSGAVKSLQRRLLRVGYAPGPIDGLFGPLTRAAVVRFQATHGLEVDGIAGPRTLSALATAASVLYPGSSDARRVRILQRRLRHAGYAPGPIDGRFGPSTEHAVQRFQAANGLSVDGIVGPRTLDRLRAHGRQTRPATPPARQPHPRSSRPHGQSGSNRGTHPPARTRPPRPGGTTAPSKRGSVPVQRHHGGGSSMPTWLWILAAVVLVLLASAAWLLLHRQRSMPSRAYRSAPGNGRTPVGHLIETSRTADQQSDPRARSIEAVGRLERLNDQVGAEVAYRQADEKGDAEGSFHLGVLLERRGEVAGAIAAYKRAEERGHTAAAHALGVMLEAEGYPDAAERAYRRADRAGNGGAAFNLGAILERRGDFAGAKAAYERAEERGVTAAASDLGVMLAAQGDLDGATAAFRRADERGDARGSFNLGVLLGESGDQAGADAALRRASERGSPDVAELAREALRDLAAGASSGGNPEKGGATH
jgi:peptidoglycan hydrolase-like protein with peptidoglycan-binding domain/tetratricopeptide (TPR) repeat protein